MRIPRSSHDMAIRLLPGWRSMDVMGVERGNVNNSVDFWKSQNFMNPSKEVDTTSLFMESETMPVMGLVWGWVWKLLRR